MGFTPSSDQKKSLVVSLLIYASMVLILFFIRFWPPSNLAELTGGGGGGVSVNFGDSDLGSGSNYESEVLEVQNQTKEIPTESTPEEAVIAQENSTEESVVITKKEKTETKTTVVKDEAKPEVVKPKVSNTTNDALSSLLKGSNKGGDGDDKTAGNKGKSNGSLSATSYYGNGGSGNGIGGGYSLGNRRAISKPAPKYTCNEEGKVVVEVSVDRNGKTVSAIAGIKGTTNTAKCLLEQAKSAALNTKWDASSDAPEKQVGKIVYNFNLN